MSPATGQSYLSRLDARPKLLAVVGFLFALGLIPAGSWIRLAALGGLLGIALLPDGAWLQKTFWQRLIPVLVLTAGMGMLLLVTRHGGVRWTVLSLGTWRVQISEGGVLAAAELSLRTALAAAALVTLSVRTTGPQLLNALAFVRLPRVFLAVLSAVARSLWIVTDEARRMNRARLMRGAGATLAARLRGVGGMIGSLLLRSLDRAERVHRAMLARGYDGGAPPLLNAARLRPVQLIACLGFVALSFTAPFAPLP